GDQGTGPWGDGGRLRPRADQAIHPQTRSQGPGCQLPGAPAANADLPQFQRGLAMIEVRALHKAFGDVVAVDEVSFVARDGEITGLLGPNGAGKTTTLRMIYTLVKPDRGEVRVD